MDSIVDVLASGALSVHGRFADASNLTLLVSCEGDGADVKAVFKPVTGMRPLHDFDSDTLPGREVAAYWLSARVGWNCIPTTLWRTESEFGPGSIQEFIDVQSREVVDIVDAEASTHDMRIAFRGEDEDGRSVHLVHEDLPNLRNLAVFDVITNNADRKAGHIIATETQIVGVDNGLAFHIEEKLRTVLWGWGGEPLLEHERDLLVRTVDVLSSHEAHVLNDWLTSAEIDAVKNRAQALLDTGVLPMPDPHRRCIPWPVF